MPHDPHARALRNGRFSEPNRLYLITTVTYDRKPLFNEFRLARTVITCMKRLHEDRVVDVLAYALMPDHLHWLIQLQSDFPLHTLMHRFKGHSAMQLNLVRNVQGVKVWQPGYHDHALRQEEDIQEVARYIVANPLRAGLVETIGQYSHWDAVWL